MINHLAIGLLSLCALWVSPVRMVAAQEEQAIGSPALHSLNQQFSQTGVRSEAPAQLSAALPQDPASSIIREIPSITGHYRLKGRMIMPYLGAGFGGGYTSDLNRSLTGPPPPVQPDAGLRSQLGQGFSPNEFQMGLRIPF